MPAVKLYYKDKPQALLDYALSLGDDTLDKDIIEGLHDDYEQGGRSLFGALVYVTVKQQEDSIGVDFFERMQEALPAKMFKIVNKLSEYDGELAEYETDEPISFFGFLTKPEVAALYDFMKERAFADHLLPYTTFLGEALKEALDKKVEVVTVHSWL